MIDIIETLHAQRVPTESYIHTGIYCNQTEYPQEKYEQFLSVLMDKPIQCDNHILSRLTYAYFCHDIVKISKQKEIQQEDIDLTFSSALVKANTLFTKNTWMWATKEPEPDQYNENGTLKLKKGWKKDRAIEIFKTNPKATKAEIIKMYEKELDMTASGAQTYYYNSKHHIEQGEL
jgi:hypothetical protein